MSSRCPGTVFIWQPRRGTATTGPNRRTEKSFDRFLADGLAETFADISPISDFTGNLELEFEFDSEDEDLKGPPKFSEKECKEKDHTYLLDQIFVQAL